MEALVCFALTAFFPRDGDLPGLAELGVEEKVARLHRESTLLFWLGLVFAAVFFQITPIVTVGQPVLAVWLSPEALDRHAYEIATSRVYTMRQIISLLKLIGGVLWGQSPEIRAFIALPPYGEDPGTRRTEPMVLPPRPVLPRTPREVLITVGRREGERGRGVTLEALVHGLDLDAKTREKHR